MRLSYIIISATALLYMAPTLATFWVLLRSYRHPQPTHVRTARRINLGIHLFILVIMILRQDYLPIGALPLNTETLVKDYALILTSFGTISMIDMLVPRRSASPLKTWAWLGLIACGATAVQWRLGLMALPTVATMAYCVVAIGYTARTFGAYGRRASNLFTKWQFRTLAFGYGCTAVYAFARAWPLPYPYGYVVRTSLIVSAIAVFLGMVMPHWYARLGTHIELLRFSRQYVDDMIGFLAIIHDHLLESKSPQRDGLALTARRIAEKLALNQEEIEILNTSCYVAPLAFVVYDGEEADAHQERTPHPAADPRNLSQSLVHFSGVYHCVRSLYAAELSPAAPVTAHIIRAAMYHLDGFPPDQIHVRADVVGALGEMSGGTERSDH